MNKKIKNILLSVIAVIVIVVGYIIFPDMGGDIGGNTSGTIADTAGIWDTDNVAVENDDTDAKSSAIESEQGGDALQIDENGEYLTKDDVAAYIHEFGKLPKNFITKNEAEDLGWVSREGNLWDVAPGYAIGGDYFGNYEGLLPESDGRKYYECDVNYEGGFRGDERIVFSNDGLIFYTNDHYESFTELYGE